MKQFLFLVNPVAGKRGGTQLREDIIACLADLIPCDTYDIAFTGPELFRDLRTKALEYATLVIAGGDGTISQTIDCLGRHAAVPKIGIIPTGTGNDLARSLNIFAAHKRSGLKGLIEIMLAGKTERVDLLQLNGTRLFTSYFGMGTDARIARTFNMLRTFALCRSLCARGLSKALFVFPAILNMLTRMDGPVQLTFHDPRKDCCRQMTLPGSLCQILVTNIKTYAGGVVIAPRCRMDDGVFEVTVVPDVRPWVAMHLHRIRSTPFDPERSRLVHFQTREITIAAPGAPPCQIDGEAWDQASGRTVRIACVAQLEMVVP
jgi:diacylglycerol kinase (ATP)